MLKQFTADSGGTAGENKVQALSAGPVIAYGAERGNWGLDLKTMQNLPCAIVRNRSQGTVTWLRLNVRLD
ncbi:hypothetical protein OU995_23715 [Roseateles sp. SL47]|uniref:hypothetical protein n=1 Tax=Roseateles sp. SL47 TaxID=2995138 RepID=UPI002271B5DD|nr:hypothetical protein [Roseateles sp. SL47]WAC72523.1 hypothetical protein OU995_23715 [Roseateles sp. SL47]